MGRKEDASSQYNLIQGYQDAIEGRRGEFQGQRVGIADFRNKLEDERGRFTSMIEDESKRGYSPMALAGMRGRAADTLSGARRTTLEDLSRRVAASGMGRTGVGIRAGMDYGRDYARQQREALRDIDIQNEEAKRSDLWNALQGNTTNLGMQQGTYDQNLAALQGETQLQALRASLYDPMNQMVDLKNQPGFWSKFGLALAGGAGQAAGAYFGGR